MNLFNTLAAVIERPETLLRQEAPAELWRAGLLGYLLGTLGIFTFFRLFAVIPPGVLSFSLVLFFVLSANLLFAAITHLFMDLTGAGGRAARLFLAFGYADFFLTLLVPLGFLAKLNYINEIVCFWLCFGIVVYARAMLVQKLYPVSANKAALSVWLPYFGFITLFVLAFSYSVAWLVWLLV